MKNQMWIKRTGMIFLMGIFILMSGIGTGRAAYQYEKEQQRKNTVPEQKTKEENNTENTTDKNKIEDTKENSFQNQEEAQKEQEKLLSAFTTESSSEALRNQNLETACRKLDGRVLKPGEVFSFNNAMGACTEEEGFTEAPVILDDTHMGMGMGGGICQAATTLYQAALLGDLEITERHRHSFPAGYVPVGADAAVAQPEKDLKIKNPYETEIQIQASAEQGKVTIRLLGAELEPGMEIRIQAVVKQELEPEGEEVRLTTELAAGERQVLQEARTGYATEVYREYYKDGEKVDQELVSSDTYPAVRGIVLEGSSIIK